MTGAGDRKLLDKFHADKAAALPNGACKRRWREYASAKFAALLWVAIFGWNPIGSAASPKLMLTGASTIAPLASEIARRFELQHPGTRIDVQSGGSSRGINDVRNGAAAIGMVSRGLKPEEKDLHAHTIAWDGVGVVL
ncbi:MAG TPA: substrate-binding domain-containing protein, partial [Nitrosospira sp.]